jgi:hypothetical protein
MLKFNENLFIRNYTNIFLVKLHINSLRARIVLLILRIRAVLPQIRSSLGVELSQVEPD